MSYDKHDFNKRMRSSSGMCLLTIITFLFHPEPSSPPAFHKNAGSKHFWHSNITSFFCYPSLLHFWNVFETSIYQFFYCLSHKGPRGWSHPSWHKETVHSWDSPFLYRVDTKKQKTTLTLTRDAQKCSNTPLEVELSGSTELCASGVGHTGSFISLQLFSFFFFSKFFEQVGIQSFSEGRHFLTSRTSRIGTKYLLRQ